MTANTVINTMRLCLLLLCVLQLAFASLEENCRNQGFDPQQLSCDTCELLKAQNAKLHSTCMECCQAYKTLHGQPQRHGYAVLIYNGHNEEMSKFVEESLPTIHHQKGSHRLEVIENDDQYAMMMPSKVYWLEEALPNTGESLDYKLRLLHGMSIEQVSVEGWQKDDLEDMLLTLLQDA